MRYIPECVTRMSMSVVNSRVVQSNTFQFAISRAVSYLPFKYVSTSTTQERPNHANAHAFPSGHNKWASYLTATTTFLCPGMNNTWRTGLNWLGQSLMLSNMIGRVLAQYHYPGDTLAGALFSLVGARAVQLLYRQDETMPAQQTEEPAYVKLAAYEEGCVSATTETPLPIRQQSISETALTTMSFLTLAVSNPAVGAIKTVGITTLLQVAGDKWNKQSLLESITDKLPLINNMKALYRHCTDDEAELTKGQVVMHTASIAVIAGMITANCLELPFTMAHGWANEAAKIVSWTSDSTANFFNYLTWGTAVASVGLGAATAVAADAKAYRDRTYASAVAIASR